jgi:hypothetical protein
MWEEQDVGMILSHNTNMKVEVLKKARFLQVLLFGYMIQFIYGKVKDDLVYHLLCSINFVL